MPVIDISYKVKPDSKGRKRLKNTTTGKEYWSTLPKKETPKKDEKENAKD